MPLRLDTPLPDLSGATAWLNGPPAPEVPADRPVLVTFWSLSCHICHENMPTINRWHEEYAGAGLAVIAVHMPRSEGETDTARVREDAEAMGITYPCAIDNTLAVADAFENTFVPAYFLFDREGKLRGRTAGHTGLSMLEPALKRVMDAG